MASNLVLLFPLMHAITIFLFLFSSIYADDSRALQSPQYCFVLGGDENVCAMPLKYPLVTPYAANESCGYPGFEVDCSQRDRGRPVIGISDHFYHVLDISYTDKVIKLRDTELDGQVCPHPKRNFSLPSSPSWVNYSLSYNDYFITIFYNCTSNPAADAEDHLLCSKEHLNKSQPAYAFYKDEAPKEGSDWYRNCGWNVVIPVLRSFNLVLNMPYTDAIKMGFQMEWAATDWCQDCERSGGQCWSNSAATGCACRHHKSYHRTCQTPPPSHQEARPTTSTTRKSIHSIKDMAIGLQIGIGLLAGVGGLLVLIALLVFWRGIKPSSLSISHWRNKTKSLVDVEKLLEKYCLALQRYKYSDIRKMTNSFKDALGEGAYGRVFKGELRDGRPVAVKVLKESKGDGGDFINEVATIGMTNHVNIVNLVGFCIEGTRRALVYEFMSNGSLERFIYTQKDSPTTLPLGWEKLYQIALGIARGLEYLHRGCNTRILHFDIKPHNILLDENFCPKISDFGLAKLYPTKESIVSTVGARGTVGYIAPELWSRTFGNVSYKSDVYSYGMMMLEMIGGRKNIDPTTLNISEIYFPLWIYNHLERNNDAKGLEEIQVKEMFEDEKAKKMIMVALWCIQAHPIDRPSMSRVIEMLEGNIVELQMPPKPSIDPRSSSSASS